ncbi:unnamed protein product [Camellia sinensis]
MTGGGARLPDRRTPKKIICDAAADGAAAIAANPPWVVKTRLQGEVSKLEPLLENEMKFERKTPFKC